MDLFAEKGSDESTVVDISQDDRPDWGSSLACNDHAQSIASELCDTFSASTSDPLRDTWWYWFVTCTWIGKLIGKAEVAIHNWRFDRGVEGKRFGYRMVRQ